MFAFVAGCVALCCVCVRCVGSLFVSFRFVLSSFPLSVFRLGWLVCCCSMLVDIGRRFVFVLCCLFVCLCGFVCVASVLPFVDCCELLAVVSMVECC